jgi:isopenicillin N synthase-like dioxygenase
MNTLTAFTGIPVVDVSGLLGDDPAEHLRVAEELGRAAREVGFLYVTGTGLPAELAGELLRVTRMFFDLPDEEKMRTWIGRSTNHRGYVPIGEEVFAGGTRDLKEAFDLGADLPADHPAVASARMLGPNQWPDVPGFVAACTAWYDAVLALGRRLLSGFALALGEPEDAFDQYVTRPPSQLRLIHYPFDPDARDAIGIGAHTDYECFTLLLPTAPGLEVLNGAGEWIDVPPREGALVVNVGDILETWTNGEFIATTHRVRRVAEERWSFPLFFNVDSETLIAPLPQFVDADEPTRVPVVAGDHLFAQTAQTFTYLRRRLESGDLVLPDGSLGLSSFGQEALQGSGRPA